MTRDELAREVALRTGVSRREAQAVIENALAVIEERLCAGEPVFLRGFGCFESRPGGRRRARDPRGDGVIEIPPRVKPVFRPYDRLREAVHSALSPSASILASAGAAQVTLWEANSGKRLLRLPVPAAPAAMLFSPDGSLLVAGVGGQLLLWESVTWTQLAAIDLPNGTVLSMAFSPDGRQIACGVSDGSVLLWGVR